MRTIRVTALAALLVAGLTACGASSGGDGKAAASAAPSGTASASAGASATATDSAAPSAAPSAGASDPAGTASPAAGATATAGGTGGTGGGTAPGTLPAPAGVAKDVLLAANGVMAKAGNARLAVGTGAVAQGGGGSFAWAQPGGIDLVLTQPDGAQARLRAAGGSTWVGAPEQTAALVGGKPWMKVDPNAKTDGSGAAAVLAGAGGEDARGLAALARVLDPAVALAAGAGSPGLAKVGVESVDGQEAVHFRATGVADALVNGLTEDQKKQALAELGRTGGALDLWINGRNELVQLRTADLTPSRAGDMTVRYTELGRAPQVAAPPVVDVFEVADLLKGFGG
ncbi:hypothetical protein ACIRBX_10170 [Kitasatospora sp. NPDC096147]|uniref:hypothetical protein n=1 Tax=Kitasatospora sp. NPDC096147 TaxID=3364093 RepID=UPI00382BC253